jgi:hypothetical protein
MTDTLDVAAKASRRLLVDGRDVAADEAVTVSDSSIFTVAAPDANGQTIVTGIADGTATVNVAPGAADANRTAGSDDITVVNATSASTPLVVSLEP